MKKYIYSIYVLSIIISFPIGFFIFVGLTKMDIKIVAIYTGIMVAYWSVYFLLKYKKRYFFWVTFIPIIFLWLILFVQEIRRVLFILENNGMDRADGYGSPMAFLLGMSFELIFFLPMSYALLNGILYLKNKKDKVMDNE